MSAGCFKITAGEKKGVCGARDLDEKKKKHDAAHARSRHEGCGAISLPRAARAFPGRHRRGKTGPHAPPPGLPAALQPPRQRTVPGRFLSQESGGAHPAARGKGEAICATQPALPPPVPPATPQGLSRPRAPAQSPGGARGARTPGLGAGTPGPGAGIPVLGGGDSEPGGGAGTTGFRAGFGRRPPSSLLRGPCGLAAPPAASLPAAARGYPVSAALRPVGPGWGARRGRPGAPRARGRVRGGGGPGLRGPGAGWSRTYAEEEAGLGEQGAVRAAGVRRAGRDTPRPGAWGPVAR